MDNGQVEAVMRRRAVHSPCDAVQRMRRRDHVLRLDEQSKAMGMLASGIAHDLNNILSTILGFGERALLAVELGSRLHHDLNHVVVASKLGHSLVDRILSFNRCAVSERVPVHVERAVAEALDLLQDTLPSHIRLHSRMQAGSAAILGDVVQIHQLLMNLVANAAHSMAHAGTLTVSLEVITVHQARQATVGAIASGNWIALQVADQGSGMTPETMDRIFEPFFTTKEVGVGAGLGLSLVLGIVKQAGGAIDVQSAPNVGSVFTLYLPRIGDTAAQSSGARPVCSDAAASA